MQENVFEILSQVMGVPRGEVNGDSSPDTIGSWDSLNHMNLIFALEDEFGVRFSDDAIVKMMDVATILTELEVVTSSSDNDA